MSTKSKNGEVKDDDILIEMKAVHGPFATAQELSNRLGISRQRMNTRLGNLKEDGFLDRKRCGSGYGWWIRDSPS